MHRRCVSVVYPVSQRLLRFLRDGFLAVGRRGGVEPVGRLIPGQVQRLHDFILALGQVLQLGFVLEWLADLCFQFCRTFPALPNVLLGLGQFFIEARVPCAPANASCRERCLKCWLSTDSRL